MMNAILSLGLIATAPTSSAGIESLLSPGHLTPKSAMTCLTSSSALGTGNVSGSGLSTTIVNLWSIRRPGEAGVLGYVVKVVNGTYWYEPPVRGMNYEKIDEAGAAALARQGLVFSGCFTSDLPTSDITGK